MFEADFRWNFVFIFFREKIDQGSEWLFYVGWRWKLQRFEFSIGIFLTAETCNVLQFQLWKRNCMQ